MSKHCVECNACEVRMQRMDGGKLESGQCGLTSFYCHDGDGLVMGNEAETCDSFERRFPEHTEEERMSSENRIITEEDFKQLLRGFFSDALIDEFMPNFKNLPLAPNIESIRSEITNLMACANYYKKSGINRGLEMALYIIDKHTDGE